MNRTELVDALAARSEITKAAADRTLANLIDIIGETLASGDKLTLVGFGSFGVTDVPARTGRNPRTGEALKMDARKRPKFTPGATLKAKVNA